MNASRRGEIAPEPVQAPEMPASAPEQAATPAISRRAQRVARGQAEASEVNRLALDGTRPTREQRQAAEDARRMAEIEQGGKDLAEAMGRTSEVPMWQRIENAGGTFSVDNPGGDWLARTREDAAAQLAKNPVRGRAQGKRTGTIRHKEFPVSELIDIPGLRDEQNYIRKGNVDRLASDMAENGFKEDMTPMVAVGMDGQPYILEGNHRIRAAAQAGLKTIPIEIAYYAGGEQVPGRLSPESALNAITDQSAAQAKLNRERMPAGGNLNMGGLQTGWEAIRKAAARDGKPMSPKFQAVKDVFSAPVTEHSGAAPFARHLSGQQDFDATVNEIAQRQHAVRNAKELRQVPEDATPGQADIIETENLSLLRRSGIGPVADWIDKKVATGFNKKVGKNSAGWTDPRRESQHLGDGEQSSALELSILDGSRQIDASLAARAEEIYTEYRALRERTEVNNTKDLEIAGKLRELYNPGTSQSDFLTNPEVRALLAESGKPKKMYEYVQETRRLEDQVLDQENIIRKAMGLDPVGRIGGDAERGYFHKQAVKPKFFQIREKIKRAAAQEGDSRTSNNEADKVNNSATRRRTSTDPNVVDLNGREVPREWNAEVVFEGYIDRMLRSIGGDVSLGESMKIAKYMDIKANVVERAGDIETAEQLRNRANMVRQIAQQQWNHATSGAGAAWDAGAEALGPVGRVGKAAIAENKRAFDNTKYRLNPKFNLIRQWTSVLNPFMADPVAGLKAMRDMGVIGIGTDGKKAADASWEAQRKRRPHSSMRDQIDGVGDYGVIKNPKQFERVYIDGITTGIENWSNRMAFLIEYNSSRAQKMSPEQRARSAGQAIFKTQSAYTFGERAPILNSRVLQGLLPAQGYSVELVNQVREAFGFTGVDSRLYGATRGDQVARASAIMAAAVLQNMFNNAVVEWLRGNDWKEKLDFDSVVDAAMALPPFVQVFIPNDNSASPFLPVSQGVGLERAVKQTISGDNPLALPAFVASNRGGPGGVLASDIMKGQYGDPLGVADEPAPQPAPTMNARPSRPQNPARPERPRTGPTRGRPPLPRRN